MGIRNALSRLNNLHNMENDALHGLQRKFGGLLRSIRPIRLLRGHDQMKCMSSSLQLGFDHTRWLNVQLKGDGIRLD